MFTFRACLLNPIRSKYVIKYVTTVPPLASPWTCSTAIHGLNARWCPLPFGLLITNAAWLFGTSHSFHSFYSSKRTCVDALPVHVSPERQSAQMSKITNDGLSRSGIGCFIAVGLPMRQHCSQRQRVKNA